MMEEERQREESRKKNKGEKKGTKEGSPTEKLNVDEGMTWRGRGTTHL